MQLRRFEVRKNDRHYQRGDTLVLQEWSPGAGYKYLDKEGKPVLPYGPAAFNSNDLRHKELTFRITYVLTDFAGIEPGYCVLGLEELT